MLDPNKVALRLFSWRIERASPPSLWPPAGGILADFWGVGSLEKRERSLEGKMQTVNSKKKKEKEKLRRYIATLWLGLSTVQGSRETLFEELLLSRCFPGRVVWRPELGLNTPLTTI